MRVLPNDQTKAAKRLPLNCTLGRAVKVEKNQSVRCRGRSSVLRQKELDAGCKACQRVDAKGSDRQDRSGEGTGFIDHNVYVSLPVAVIRHSDKGNLRVTGLILAHSLRYNSSWLGSQGSWSLKHLSDVRPMVRIQGSGHMYSAQLNLCLQPKSREWSCPQLRWVFPRQLME